MQMTSYRDVMELIGLVVDGVGVLIIVVGAVIATARFLVHQRSDFSSAYRGYRQGLGRAILLGLELLVAGDIIRTVAVAPTLENVVILAVIVLIRTFLSMTLELEIEGRWPWKRAESTGGRETH